MSFALTCETRHTDTYAATGFVHAGVLLALTERAYAAYQDASGVRKSEQVVAVPVRTRAEYLAPLPWQDGAVVDVVTVASSGHGFSQRFSVRSAVTDRLIARIEHDWVWLDTASGRALPFPPEAQSAFADLDHASAAPAPASSSTMP